MDFQTAVRTCLSKYVDFSGRARRSEFWWWALFNFLVSVVASVLDAILGTGYDSGGGLLNTVAGLALFLPSLAVAARRLHDGGRSAWWLLLILIPVLGWIVLLVFYLGDSQAGDNQYGPNPKSDTAGGYPPPPPPSYGSGQYNG